MGLLLWTALGGLAAAQISGEEEAPSELDIFALEEGLRGRVVEAATRRVQTVQSAPAVVEVITAADIRLAGYQSVGEALGAVAGLAVYNDLAYWNVGVRGTFGGLRAGSRILKLLLDGQPVAYRTSSANFLGPELVPIEAVERIEVIRGPGSVLYGANAFLGVVNVVTKSASAVARLAPGGTEALEGAAVAAGVVQPKASPPSAGELEPEAPDLGYWGEIVVGAASGGFEAVGAAALARLDRSGLRLPDSSPQADKLVGSPFSRADIAQPRTLFARVAYQSAALGRVRAFGSLVTLDAVGEFQDRNTLNRDNRISLTHGFIRAEAQRDVGERLQLRAFGAYAQGAPNAENQVKLRGTPFALRLDTAYRAVDTGVDASYDWPQLGSVLAGADFTWDEERNPTSQVVFTETQGFNEAGSVKVARSAGGAVAFRNTGAFALATATPFGWAEGGLLKGLGLTAGLRWETNSVYGATLNWRAGAVLPVGESWYGKLLGGSSFKGPSAEELFTIPLQEGDPTGNPRLRPQTAVTVEAVAGYLPSKDLSASLVAYANFVRDQIQYRDDLIVQRPENVTLQDTQGLELQVRFSRLLGPLAVQGFANASILRTYQERPGATANLPPVPVEPEMYPSVTANLGLAASHRPTHLAAYLEARFLGSRPASFDNVDAWRAGRPYSLPPVALFDATLSTEGLRPFGGSEVRLVLRVTNLLDTTYALPGFFGYDVPGLQRTFSAKLVVAL